MPLIAYFPLLLLALGVAGVAWRQDHEATLRKRTHTFAALAVLCALGLALAGPFLTSRPVGSGEAYNYSLALADGVSQLREGQLPVLVGQTEFAFNGRIHPLRNAPYLVYFAGVLDALTFRQLSFWELQNLSLVGSLLAALLLTWLALRWSAGAGAWGAAGFSAVYAGSAAVLGAAYGQDLFMTVHAAAFVPLALAAAARPARCPGAGSDAVLAAALAFTWWAHPPVAAWTTAVVIVMRVSAMLLRPSWDNALAGLAGALATAVMVQFVVVSATEVTPFGEIAKSNTLDRGAFLGTLAESLRAAFPASVLPVSRSARELTDLQLGYGLALLLGVIAWFTARGGPSLNRTRRAIGALLASAAVLLAVLALPIPWLTLFLWSKLPSALYTLTSIWPMQRLYLVATAAIVVAGMWILPNALRTSGRRPRTIASLTGLLLLGWMAWEATAFLQRGYGTRWPEVRAQQSHLPQNLDLTITSYSFLGLPATFVHGVSEPWAEFNLLRNGEALVASNYREAITQGKAVAEGSLLPAEAEGLSGRWVGRVHLHPESHYILTFDWLLPPGESTLLLAGSQTGRNYRLPTSGEPRSFGFGGQHRSGFALSNPSAEAEDIEIVLQQSNPLASAVPPAALANFRLLEIDPEQLPVELHGLLPLRATVRAPEAGLYVETPRRFINGYEATVNGRMVRPVRSPDGNVMLPVPQGEHTIELTFSGSRQLRTAFWSSLSCGVALLVLGAARTASRRHRHLLKGWAVLGGAVATGLMVVAAGHREPVRPRPAAGAGPILLQLQLPMDRPGAAETILASGEPGAGNIVYLVYEDANHVRVGVDIWGRPTPTGRVAVDYRQPQELTIQAGFLLPEQARVMQAYPKWRQQAMQSQLRVELNGQVVIDEPAETYPSDWDDVSIGRSLIGGSLAAPEFSGAILAAQRLPVSPVVNLADGSELQVRWPGLRTGITEPLLSGKWNDGQELFTATYEADGGIRFSYWQNGVVHAQSKPRPLDLRAPSTLRWTVEQDALVWSVNEEQILTIDQWHGTRGSAYLHWAGFNHASVAGVSARFTGRWVVPPGLTAEVTQVWGPVQMLVTFPEGAVGTAEPLLATGVTGRADVLFVKYVDEDHVIFGLDHWGIGSWESPPVQVKREALHRLEISMGSLLTPATVNQRASDAPNAVVVKVDGTEVWRLEQETYDVPVSAIEVGTNTIGASSCGPRFTGQILLVERGPN